MIRRTFDPSFLNTVANHPEVLPFIGGNGAAVDLTALISNRANIAIEADHGGWILTRLEPGIYELHTMFLPEGRGKLYFTEARDALRYVFVETDATEIVTKCPDSNRSAAAAANIAGFKEKFRREKAWADGSGISYRSLTIEDWRQKDAEVLRAGRWFHERLDDLINHAAHDEDEAHDRAVGSAVLMARAGALPKGIAFYNRWARFAGYVEAQLLGPNIVDFAEAIIEVKGQDMAVLLHRRELGGASCR